MVLFRQLHILKINCFGGLKSVKEFFLFFEKYDHYETDVHDQVQTTFRRSFLQWL